MKRRRLLRHLLDNGCEVHHEGGDHTWVINELTGKKSFVPRHREIKSGLVRAVCRQLGIPAPREK